jgi:flagellar protein FlgJ
MSFVQYTPRPSDNVSVLDLGHLNSLKRGVEAGAGAPHDKQKEVARQFEALFIQQMLKQARQATATPAVFDSQQTRRRKA